MPGSFQGEDDPGRSPGRATPDHEQPGRAGRKIPGRLYHLPAPAPEIHRQIPQEKGDSGRGQDAKILTGHSPFYGNPGQLK